MQGELAAAIGGAAFWLSIAAVVVAAIVTNGQRKREEQRTIQKAIENGQTLDPQLLDRLLGSHATVREGRPEDFYIGGIVMIMIGVGLLALGYFATPAPGDRFGMAGVAILVVLLGVGILIGGVITAAANRRRLQRGGPGAP